MQNIFSHNKDQNEYLKNYKNHRYEMYICCSIHFKDEIQLKHPSDKRLMDLFHYVREANFKIVEKMVSKLESDNFKGIVKTLPHHDE